MRRFLRGFRYAWAGITAAVRTERNFRFHLCAAVFVLWFSRYYSFTKVEYALLALCVGGVMALELVNSAVERAVDKPDVAHWRAAGSAKDMAAGAVLVFSMAAAVVGLCLFGDWNVICRIARLYAGNPPAAAGLLLSAVLAVLFIRGRKPKDI